MLQSDSSSDGIPNEFLWRRLHSLTGIFLVLFLCEHLLTNSQAALLIGDDGNGFVRAVSFIHSLPYLPAIEIFLLAVPILAHAAWGVRYLLTAKPNSWPGDGSQPVLSQYKRNHAYTWQRITSWILLIGILVHVWEMRFEHYPSEAFFEGEHYYMVRISEDEGLYTVADRLGVTLLDAETIEQLSHMPSGHPKPAVETQRAEQFEEFRQAIEVWDLEENQVVAATTKIGTAMLLTIRDTMKSFTAMVLYSVFVIAASFHAFNGLWSACIVWGITLTDRSQAIARKASTGLMLAVMSLGLVAIWGTYWLNLFQ